jgi:hypothetical protein
MKRRRTRRTKAALPVNPVEQVLGELFGEVQRTLFQGLFSPTKPQTPMYQPPPPSDIKDVEVISIRDNP